MPQPLRHPCRYDRLSAIRDRRALQLLREIRDMLRDFIASAAPAGTLDDSAPRCRACGAYDEIAGGTWWPEPDLCGTCAPRHREAVAIEVAGVATAADPDADLTIPPAPSEASTITPADGVGGAAVGGRITP